jgi:Cof subfamily protein (haloacid dehalogenase superfamily)
MSNIRMVAVDMDGTFCRPDLTFDVPRFQALLAKMKAAGCHFVVASGNQYFQLRDFFPGYWQELTFVAENGAYVREADEVIFCGQFAPDVVDATLDWIEADPQVKTILSCEDMAYMQRGTSEEYFRIMQKYYHHLSWADDLRTVGVPVLKFALNVPSDQTWEYVRRFRTELPAGVEPTSSGHGEIDLIVPGCHKASGLQRLADRWGIAPEECVAFGDGGNDIEMLRWAGIGYAMENASDEVKAAADRVCSSNADDGVLVALEELFA